MVGQIVAQRHGLSGLKTTRSRKSQSFRRTEKLKIKIIYPLPPSLNEIVNEARSHWRKGARQKKAITGEVEVLSYGVPPFEGKVWLSFLWKVKSFGRDPDNTSAGAKFILDGLVAAGVLPKDNLTIIQSPFVHWFERGDDEVEVTISDQPIFELIETEKQQGFQKSC